MNCIQCTLSNYKKTVQYVAHKETTKELTLTEPWPPFPFFPALSFNMQCMKKKKIVIYTYIHTYKLYMCSLNQIMYSYTNLWQF